MSLKIARKEKEETRYSGKWRLRPKGGNEREMEKEMLRRVLRQVEVHHLFFLGFPQFGSLLRRLPITDLQKLIRRKVKLLRTG